MCAFGSADARTHMLVLFNGVRVLRLSLSVYMSLCVYVCVCVSLSVCLCLCPYIRLCMFMSVFACVHLRLRCVRLYVCTCACVVPCLHDTTNGFHHDDAARFVCVVTRSAQ